MRIRFLSQNPSLGTASVLSPFMTVLNVKVPKHLIFFRYHVQSKKKQAYKTLTYSINTARIQHTNSHVLSGAANDFVGLSAQHVPTYSGFAGQDEFNDAVDNNQISTGSSGPCVGL